MKKLIPRDSAVEVQWKFRLILALAILVATCSGQERQRLEQVVKSYADTGWFMGTVLVAQRGKVLLDQGYGYADLEWDIKNSPTTRFLLASMTKQFTAASILLLEDRGKLKTDDLVKKYVPQAPASWDKITIYNLLTHTSGIPNEQAKVLPNAAGKTSIEFREMPLRFQPGEQWQYSNVGYAVLGYLVEQVSGQSYADFVQENIFSPLRMHDSGFDSNVTIIPRRASGYVPGANGPENAKHTDLSLAFSAGALYSTTEDLFRWEEGLFGGRLLTSRSLQKMTAPFKNDYACGLFVKRANGHLIVEHSGDVIGFNTDMAYYPEDKLAVIVLGNLNSIAVGKIATALASVIHGESVSLDLPKEIALPKEVLARYAGTYEFEGFKLVVTLEGGHLAISGGANQPEYVLFAESETQFHRKVIEEQLEFSANDKGEFAFLTLRQEGRDMKGQKEKIGQ